MGEKEEKVEKAEKAEEGFPCPRCGKPQKEFLYSQRKYGWAQCPSCKQWVRKSEIPEQYIREVEDVELKSLETSPKRTEELWKRPKTPTEILSDILEEYGVKEAARNIILRKSERMGGIHPNALYSMLRDLDTGIPDKAVHYLVDDYYWALRREEEEARRSGYDMSYPLESYRGVEERGWYGYPSREPEYRYRAPEYGYRTPEYERYRYEYEPRRESSRETRFLTAEEFEERLRRFFMEQESEKRMSELASFVYRELPDRMRMEIDKRVSEAVTPIKEMLSEIKSSIEEMSTRKPQEEPKKTLTAEDLERILAKERDIQQKEFDKRLLEMELKYNRELSEREKVQLQNQIKELNKQIDELSRELREAKTGRTAYDLAHEMIQAGKEIIKEDKPIRGVVREALGRPAQEKPPKRKESKASELSPEELESLGIPYEAEPEEGEGK